MHIKYTNGEPLAHARQEDNEDDEVSRNIQEGRWLEESDQGGEKDVQEAQGRRFSIACECWRSSSHGSSLKKSVCVTYKQKWVVAYFNS